jgi:hypothetical protein
MSTNHRAKAINFIQDKDTNKDYSKKLYQLLKEPMSRRMAATSLGFPDQTYMVTQMISDWIKLGRAQVIGVIKCRRSQRMVEMVTTDEQLFEEKESKQLHLFSE